MTDTAFLFVVLVVVFGMLAILFYPKQDSGSLSDPASAILRGLISLGLAAASFMSLVVAFFYLLHGK